MKNEILWIIEEFELGAITAFECIQQIKAKTKSYMNENWQIVCYSKQSDWEQVVRRNLSEENAYEMLAELNCSEANGYQGFYVNKD